MQALSLELLTTLPNDFLCDYRICKAIKIVLVQIAKYYCMSYVSKLKILFIVFSIIQIPAFSAVNSRKKEADGLTRVCH